MIRTALTFAVLVLTGCASCNQATFVKPELINYEKEIKVVKGQPYVAMFRIENIQLAINGICPGPGKGVCGVISVPEGTALRFVDNKFVHSDATTKKNIDT